MPRIEWAYRTFIKPLVRGTVVERGLKGGYGFARLEQIGNELALENNGYSAKFHCGSLQEYYSLRSFSGEKEILKDLLDSLEDGDVFFDIGSHFGLYSGFVASSPNDVQIIAFDPQSENLRKAFQNIVLNGGIRDSSLYDIVVGDSKKFVGFSADAEDSSVFSKKSDASRCTPQYSIDGLIDEGVLVRPSVLKIDVEGAELDVLEGAKDALGDVRLVFCEVHKNKLDDPVRVDSFLQNAGFSITRLQESPETYHIRAE